MTPADQLRRILDMSDADLADPVMMRHRLEQLVDQLGDQLGHTVELGAELAGLDPEQHIRQVALGYAVDALGFKAGLWTLADQCADYIRNGKHGT